MRSNSPSPDREEEEDRSSRKERPKSDRWTKEGEDEDDHRRGKSEEADGGRKGESSDNEERSHKKKKKDRNRDDEDETRSKKKERRERDGSKERKRKEKESSSNRSKRKERSGEGEEEVDKERQHDHWSARNDGNNSDNEEDRRKRSGSRSRSRKNRSQSRERSRSNRRNRSRSLERGRNKEPFVFFPGSQDKRYAIEQYVSDHKRQPSDLELYESQKYRLEEHMEKEMGRSPSSSELNMRFQDEVENDKASFSNNDSDRSNNFPHFTRPCKYWKGFPGSCPHRHCTFVHATADVRQAKPPDAPSDFRRVGFNGGRPEQGVAPPRGQLCKYYKPGVPGSCRQRVCSFVHAGAAPNFAMFPGMLNGVFPPRPIRRFGFGGDDIPPPSAHPFVPRRIDMEDIRKSKRKRSAGRDNDGERQEGNWVSGTISYWNSVKGYGFMDCDDGGPDLFVHCRVLKVAFGAVKAVLPGTKVKGLYQRQQGKDTASELVGSEGDGTLRLFRNQADFDEAFSRNGYVRKKSHNEDNGNDRRNSRSRSRSHSRSNSRQRSSRRSQRPAVSANFSRSPSASPDRSNARSSRRDRESPRPEEEEEVEEVEVEEEETRVPTPSPSRSASPPSRKTKKEKDSSKNSNDQDSNNDPDFSRNRSPGPSKDNSSTSVLSAITPTPAPPQPKRSRLQRSRVEGSAEAEKTQIETKPAEKNNETTSENTTTHTSTEVDASLHATPITSPTITSTPASVPISSASVPTVENSASSSREILRMKLRYNDSVFRLSLQAPITWERMVDVLKATPDLKAPFSIMYEDEDKDMIRVISTENIHEAMELQKVVAGSNTTLNLFARSL